MAPKKARKLTITIALGNDAMTTGYHAAMALKQAANVIAAFENLAEQSGTLHVIKDANGNTVGRLTVSGGRS
jgi:hypothetical protein